MADDRCPQEGQEKVIAVLIKLYKETVACCIFKTLFLMRSTLYFNGVLKL